MSPVNPSTGVSSHRNRQANTASGSESRRPTPTAMAVSSTCWRVASRIDRLRPDQKWSPIHCHQIHEFGPLAATIVPVTGGEATSVASPRDLTTTVPAVIRLEEVTKRFAGGQIAVDHLSLEVPEGDLCVLVGPSGCGKTT